MLNNPLLVLYCATSYEGRYNPNHALIQLTENIEMACKRPWYGTVLVLKFATVTCTSYVDLTVDDVSHIRDYFAYFA